MKVVCALLKRIGREMVGVIAGAIAAAIVGVPLAWIAGQWYLVRATTVYEARNNNTSFLLFNDLLGKIEKDSNDFCDDWFDTLSGWLQFRQCHKVVFNPPELKNLVVCTAENFVDEARQPVNAVRRLADRFAHKQCLVTKNDEVELLVSAGTGVRPIFVGKEQWYTCSCSDQHEAKIREILGR